MVLPSINTREDLDAIANTTVHAAFIKLLEGTLWRLEKDDSTQTWVAIEDNSTIERFGFTREDFKGVQPPDLPEYVSTRSVVPDVVSMRQARLALMQRGLLAQVDIAIAAMPSPEKEVAQIEWGYASAVDRTSALVQGLATVLGLTETDLDSLFTLAGTL